MTSKCLGVGCERQSKLLFGLARIPLLLFRHRCRVRSEKREGIKSVVDQEIIQFPRLRLVDGLPRFVEPLQGKGVVGEIAVGSYWIRGNARALSCNFRSFFVLPLSAAHDAQIDIGTGCPWVALNRSLKRLRRFIQFSGYIRVVGGGDIELFPLAGMFPQVKCFGEVLAAPPSPPERGVAVAQGEEARCKIRVKLDGTLEVRQGRGGASFVLSLLSKAQRFQSFERRRGGLCERNI